MRGRAGIYLFEILTLAVVLLLPAVVWGQSSAGDTPGIDSGGYNIHQTIDAGYRGSWVNGNKDTYDTFENLGSGLRLFDYSLQMRSLDHKGILFDVACPSTTVCLAVGWGASQPSVAVPSATSVTAVIQTM